MFYCQAACKSNGLTVLQRNQRTFVSHKRTGGKPSKQDHKDLRAFFVKQNF